MQQVRDRVVIIGGGPAGAAAAIALARAGCSPCLLERRQSAHDKVCGEFISWEAARSLERLGINLSELGAKAIRHLRLYNGKAVLETPLPAVAWSLSRRVLDAALLEEAQKAGAELRYGMTVRSLFPAERGGWQITARGSRHSQSELLQAGTVFLASGKHELRSWPRHDRQDHNRKLGLKMHLRLSAGQHRLLHEHVEMYLYDGGYAGLEPIEEDKVNLCLLIDKESYQRIGKNWSDLLSWLSSSSPHLGSRLAGAQSLWSQPLAIYGTPYGFVYRPSSSVTGLYRLGDQMAVIPSFAGDGIAIALHSGILAAHTQLTGNSEKDYHRQALADFRKPVRNAQLLSRLLAQRSGRKAAFVLGRLQPQLLSGIIRGIRLQ